MKRILLAVCVLLLRLHLTVNGQVPTDNPQRSNTDKAVHAAIIAFFSDGCHVGLSLAVYDHGKISLYNYGSVKKGSKQLPTTTSQYEIGSLTKTFTGSLLAKAVLDNKVDLDTDIRWYLKEPYPNLQYAGIPITLRQLATHQSGLPTDVPDNSELFKQPDFDKLPFQLIAREKSYDNDKYRQELHLIKPDTIPGSIYFRYSNIGVKLESFILEDIYQKSYEQLLEKFIFSPLGIQHTVLTVRDSSNMVSGYSSTGKLMPYALDNAGSAGGIRSCSADMAKYLIWHMNEKDPWVRETHSILHGDLFYYARGYHWNMEKKQARKKIWQSGGTFGMSSAMIMYPQEQIGFVLLANDACMDTQGKLSTIAENVIQAMAGK